MAGARRQGRARWLTFLLDSDLLIWHLRGRERAVEQVVELSRRGLGISAITRAEIVQGMRETEREPTFALLDACETLPADAATADRAGNLVRVERAAGRTLHLPDAIIAVTAIEAEIPLFTCNSEHYRIDGLDLRAVEVG